MRIGISTYAFAWSIGVPGFKPEFPMSVAKFMEVCHDFGAAGVQIADNIPLHGLSFEAVSIIKKQATQLNLFVEVGTRGLKENNIQQYLRIAEALESPILRVVIDQPGFEPSIHWIIDQLKDWLPEFSSRKIRLAIENHDRFTAQEFQTIIESVNSEWVGICLDSANSLGADQGFFEVAKILIPYTINLHLKDYQIRRFSHNLGFEVIGKPAGCGKLPISWLLNELRAIGRCQSVILELWPPPESKVEATIQKEWDWVGQSMDYLLNLNLTK